MGNYSSAYEEYYKNINNKSITKESGNRGPFLNRGVNNTQSNKFQSCNAEEIYYFSKDYWIRRIERELAGSLALLACFMGLKYTNIKNVQDFYKWCKQNVVSEFNYDQSVEVLNSMEIGTFKTKDFKIGTFEIEDLKSENLKTEMKNFKEYINKLQGEKV